MRPSQEYKRKNKIYEKKFQEDSSFFSLPYVIRPMQRAALQAWRDLCARGRTATLCVPALPSGTGGTIQGKNTVYSVFSDT